MPPRSSLLLLLFGALALGAAPALAREEIEGPEVYQQRTPDGRIVLSDHPVEGAKVQRTWQTWQEDPQAARERRLRIQREAEAVSQRIQRRIDLQEQAAARSETDRLRMALVEAERDAERARAERDAAALVVVPGRVRQATLRAHPPGATMRPQPPRRHPQGSRIPSSES
jgi:hypothetical protein